MPTAYAISSRAVMYGPRDLASGLWLYLTGAVFGMTAALDSGYTQRFRKYSAAAAVVAVTAIGPPAYTLVVDAPALPVPPLESLGLAAMAAAAAGAWLLARTCARLVVAWVDRRERWVPAPTAAIAAWMLVGALAVDFRVEAHHGFLLATLVAIARETGETQPVPRLIWPALVLPAALAAWGVLRVDPQLTDDPRQYEARVLEQVRLESPDVARRLLDRMDEFAGADRRLRLDWARAELAGGSVRDAALHFAAALDAVRPDEHEALPAPHQTEWRPVLSDLRDAVSAGGDPAALPAFARALVAAGQPDGAVELLRRRASPAPVPAGVAPQLVAQTIAVLLGDGELAGAIGAWPDDLIWGVAEAIGADVSSPAPGGAPTVGPVVVGAVYGYDLVRWSVVSTSGLITADLRGRFPSARAGADHDPADARWRLDAADPGDAGARFLLAFDAADEPIATMRYGAGRAVVAKGGEAATGRLPVGWCMLVWSPDGDGAVADPDIPQNRSSEPDQSGLGIGHDEQGDRLP